MPEFNVKLAGSQVSDDGTTTKLITRSSAGKTVALLFASDELEMLMLALAQAAGHSARIRQKDASLKKVLPIEWWEINPHPSKDGLLLSFRMTGGIEATFHLPREPALRFEEVLTTLLGTRTSVASTGPLH